MRIDDFIVEPGREEHIARHSVSLTEVNEVIFGDPLMGRTQLGRWRLIGQTLSGRYLTVIVARRKPWVYALVTARDADEAERRLYRAQRRR